MNTFYDGQQISLVEMPGDKGCHEVGCDGVTEITVSMQNGQGATLAWFRIHRKVGHGMVNSLHTASVWIVDVGGDTT